LLGAAEAGAIRRDSVAGYPAGTSGPWRDLHAQYDRC
jgi:hypothetical protein